MPLSQFHPIIADWFRERVGTPTDVQEQSWPAIASGSNVLIAAPTGSGKTLSAFLYYIDLLFRKGVGCELEDRTHVVYVSPLKALSNDIQKNLQKPLSEISDAALAAGLLMPDIRVTVRTGDTPAWDRRQMLRRPPHMLITTPESLFLLLTAEKSRRILRDVRTVIVDEIHAVVPNKRGSHLALSLERLEAEAGGTLTRIGLSATQRPIETIARFLIGRRPKQDSLPCDGTPGVHPSLVDGCRIIDVGHRREMDLAVEVPKDELGPVASNAIWRDIYDRVAEFVRAHRSTLVFVNTRRLAERVAHHLEARLQDLGANAVAAHHGSLSRQIRLSAEERLKRGQTRVVVATASLELGIDIGTVDLVCHIGSPRAIAIGLQRVGRAGHWVGAIPKGRLFATTRDELLECAALVQAIRGGQLDRVHVPPAPFDILAQQIVAMVAVQEWREEDVFALCRRAFPYHALTRPDFDAVVRMLSDGIATRKGRGQALVYHDRINKRLRARRGARLAAITSGGAIPDTAQFTVKAEPEGTVVGSVDEDFAVESLAGDIILLGTHSWRIRGVGKGTMWVEDAHGAPPTIPFWRGEAPGRTIELSAEVASLRSDLDSLLTGDNSSSSGASLPSPLSRPNPHPLPLTPDSSPIPWLQSHCGLDQRGAEQAIAYLLAGRAVLGTVPTQQKVVAERFFDESGGMQLVIHAPFGSRINRAWGLALRKRFCVTFDFELQAAATDEGIVISLGERHSFPLESVFGFLHSNSIKDVLTHAVLAAPMFATRWRWNATRALAMLRFAKGRRVPPQIQRMRAEDLLAAVFPAAVACQENLRGDAATREIPDHPLVCETVRDCLTEAMDVDGLITVLQQIEAGEIDCVALDTPMPSPFCHEILNANPYAFLDDAPLEERRARAVEMRRSLPQDLADAVGALDPEAIRTVVEEAWPVVRDPDELHDALLTLVWVPDPHTSEWARHLSVLLQDGRAREVTQLSPLSGVPIAPEVAMGHGRGQGKGAFSGHGEGFHGYVATERLAVFKAVFPQAHTPAHTQQRDTDETADRDEAVLKVVQGWMECLGPVYSEELAQRLGLVKKEVDAALHRLEADGQILRGKFRSLVTTSPRTPYSSPSLEWCHRRLLARIHRLTIGRLRREIEPVSAAAFMRFLLQWQHLAPGARLHGEAGLEEVLHQLTGFEAPASAWERAILPLRMSNYDHDFLDRLCLRGAVAWGRLSPHPRLEAQANSGTSPVSPKRVMATSVAPIALFLREDSGWLLQRPEQGPPGTRPNGPFTLPAVSSPAQDIAQYLQARGASFFVDLVQGTGHLHAVVEQSLWELVAAGVVTADGFDNLRALLDPRRRRGQGRERGRRPRHSPGRWSLLRPTFSFSDSHSSIPTPDPTSPIEPLARQLLSRYGVVFRDLLARESLSPPWRDLLVQYRKLELRGEVRGGRFVAGFTGDQFALPEAVESLRAMRKTKSPGGTFHEIKISATDPLNLAGIILPGPRVPAFPTNYLVLRDGIPIHSGHSGVGVKESFASNDLADLFQDNPPDNIPCRIAPCSPSAPKP